MWTIENRARYDRSALRYASDLTYAEWVLIAPLLSPAKLGGNKRTINMRAVVDALMYVLSKGCQLRALPTDMPARSTVYGYFELWDYDGTLMRIYHTLFVQCRAWSSSPSPPSTANASLHWLNSCSSTGLRSLMCSAHQALARPISPSSPSKRPKPPEVRLHDLGQYRRLPGQGRA